MPFDHPDPKKLEILETTDKLLPWIAYSNDPDWVAISIKRTGVVLRFATKEEAERWKADQLRVLPVLQQRHCGECHACCVLLAIEELEKPPNVRCKHLGVKNKPCTIYDQRPPTCREYLCGWRFGIGAGADRPDRVGLLLSPHDNLPNIIPDLAPFSFIAREVRPDARHEARARKLLRRTAASGLMIFVVYGERLNKCQVVGPDDLVLATMRWCEQQRRKAPFGILARYEEHL